MLKDPYYTLIFSTVFIISFSSLHRLVNSLMMHGRNNGKKLMTVRIVKHSFEIIHLLTGEVNSLKFTLENINIYFGALNRPKNPPPYTIIVPIL